MLVARSGWGRAAVLAARAAATSTSSPSRSEHWYDLKTGSPFVPQDRSERRPMASTAGQRGLVPSVTTIMSIVHKRNLDYWRTSTMLQAAVEIHEKLLLEHQARVLHDRLVEQGEISESDIVQASMLLQSAVDGGNLPGTASFACASFTNAFSDETIPLEPPEAVERVAQAAASIERGEPMSDISPDTSVVDRSFFMRAATAAYFDRLRQAPSFGGLIHSLIEVELRRRASGSEDAQDPVHDPANDPEHHQDDADHADAMASADWPPDLLPFRIGLLDWLDNNVDRILHVESSFASRYGFGGRIDLVCVLRDGRVCVCDFKTQSARTGRVTWHAEWPCQLAAYAVGADVPEAALINVVFNTADAHFGAVATREWACGSANSAYWETFVDAYRLWKGPLGRNFRDHAVPGGVNIGGRTWEEVVKAASEGTAIMCEGRAASDDEGEERLE